MGLLETKGMDWDCYVGLQFTPEHEHNYLLAPAGSLVSSIPGLKEVLGDKEASTWIVKPQRRYLSLGMHLATLLEADLASAGAVAAWATRETPLEEKKRARHTKQPGEFTMQRYVTRPATLGRRKFDLRLWTLVASLEPLSVYVLDVAKISVVDYEGWGLPRNASTLPAKCMHILMMASEFCLKHMTFPRPWPYDYPGDELHGHEARVYGARDGELSRRSKRFALLSPDALWDAEIGGWRLEEINTNGLFQLGADEGEDVRTFHVDEGYTEAWLQIAGVLAAAAHENAHASSGWYRAWPPVDCGGACGAADLADDAGVMALFEAATRGPAPLRLPPVLDRAYFASPSAARPDDGDRSGLVDPTRGASSLYRSPRTTATTGAFFGTRATQRRE
ncbi:hypothetical protein JL722_7613 [Aureococcus anophagefferens]|nr:hypothetical protein JL722_7613 [Aureococcus anophagefferens]